MAQLKLYNTLTRKKEIFKPISQKHVGIYTCGPTVYWYQHIGNLKAYIFADILKRTLLYNNYKVKHVINITDVGHLTNEAEDKGEDKIEKAAKKEGKTAKEIADFYLKIFQEDIKKLNILTPNIWCKATEHIKEQIALIKILEKKSFTYKTSDGIYFDSSKFKDYGKLTNIKIEGLKAGKRIALGEKKRKTDFALWKFSSPEEKRQQEWPSPWGVGFPGWHIECSAMSMKYLGKHFDIHTGGEDHAPIHHNNEIAQSEAATGKKFVNYWLHEAFLLFKGEKVSKSKGGLYTLSELESLGYNASHYRYLNLLTHYRKQMNFSLEILDAAKSAYEKIKRKILEIKSQAHKAQDKTKIYELQFIKSINNDLNTPKALQVFHKALDDFNFDPKKKLALLYKFDKVLSLKLKEIKEEKIQIPNEIHELLDKRETARKNKDFAEADALRQQIKEKGYFIEDTPEGPKIKKV